MNVNKVILAGNLTRDPELRYTQSGTALCKFGVAINETYTSNGEKKQKTVFVDVVAWARMGEVINEHLGKGDPIYIEGRLEFSQWTDNKTGGSRSKLEVTAEKFQFVGPKRDSAPAKSRDDSVPF